MEFETAHVKYEDSAMGKLQGSLATQHTECIDELQKLREEFDKYRADNATYRTEQDRKLKIESRRNLIVSIVSGVVSASLANLFIYYWPSIVSFLTKLFQ